MEDLKTNKLPPAGYTITRTPKDPIVGLVLSVLLVLAVQLGGLPDGVDAATLELALEGTAAGVAVLCGAAVAVWRARVKNGNELR